MTGSTGVTDSPDLRGSTGFGESFPFPPDVVTGDGHPGRESSCSGLCSVSSLVPCFYHLLSSSMFVLRRANEGRPGRRNTPTGSWFPVWSVTKVRGPFVSTGFTSVVPGLLPSYRLHYVDGDVVIDFET